MPEAFTVSQVNEYVKMQMEADSILSSIAVRGEISNFIHHRSGHFYFSLKDPDSAIKAVMFRSSVSRMRFLPENGMKVIVYGRVDTFVRDGVYQLYAEDMEPDGVGQLYMAFEQLKRKLEAEGLFDPARKKPLPRYPKKIGVITSETGAALRDMIHICSRRYPLAQLVLYPALVQGPDAPASLRRGVAYFNRTQSVDVIIIGRGGGSLEDLYGFNDEALAREIAASSIPTVSAVGHETDFTICDFVADLRAPTPSAAAELVCPDSGEIRRFLLGADDTMASALTHRIGIERARLSLAVQSHALSSPLSYTQDKRLLLDSLTDRLDASADKNLTQNQNAFSLLCTKMEALSPLSVLARGYAIAHRIDSEGGETPLTAKTAKAGDLLSIRLEDGEIGARVENVIKKKGNRHGTNKENSLL